MTTTTTEATTPAPRRERLPYLGGVVPLPHDLEALAPDEVRDASRAFAEAQDRHRQAVADLRAAREATEQAARADREAAAQAVAKGNSMPTPTEPAARAQVAEAERVAAAAEELARAAQGTYLRTMREHLGEFRAAAEGERHEAEAALDGLLQDAEGLLLRGRYLGTLLAELDPDALTGRYVQFAPCEPRRGLGRDVDAAFDTLRAVVRAGG